MKRVIIFAAAAIALPTLALANPPEEASPPAKVENEIDKNSAQKPELPSSTKSAPGDASSGASSGTSGTATQPAAPAPPASSSTTADQ